MKKTDVVYILPYDPTISSNSYGIVACHPAEHHDGYRIYRILDLSKKNNSSV